MKKQHLVFGFILLVAITVRFYGLWELPLFGDELGVLIRTTGVNLKDLISLRIMEQDVHPVGMQLLYFFMYQTLGLALPWLKLLSVLASLGSMWFVYKLAQERSIRPWLALSCMAVLQIFVFYSTLIRPYAFAQLAVLAYVHAHFRLVKKERLVWRNVWILSILFVVMATVHYMAVLSGVVFFAMMFPFRENWRYQWRYLCIGGLALLLYLPQFPVFLYHLGKGDPGQWLSAPEATFLWDFILYTFHYSVALMAGFLLILVLGSWLRIKAANYLKMFWEGLGVFVGVLVVVWLYSVFVAPMLQFSTLFIVLPLLLLFFSSVIPEKYMKLHGAASLFVLVVGIVSLVYQRQHYTRISHSGTETLNILAGEFAQQGGAAYLLQPKAHFNFFVSYPRVPKAPIHSLDTQAFSTVSKWLVSDTASRLGYGWNRYRDFERIPWLYDQFGQPTNTVDLYNAQWLTFDKITPTAPQHVFKKSIGKELKAQGWQPSDMYSPVYRMKMNELTTSEFQFISLRATIDSLHTEKLYYLVVKLVRNGHSVHDVIQPINRFVSLGTSGKAYATVLPFAVTPNTDDLTVEFFVWNPEGEKVRVSDLDVLVTPGNDAALGIFRDY